MTAQMSDLNASSASQPITLLLLLVVEPTPQAVLCSPFQRPAMDGLPALVDDWLFTQAQRFDQERIESDQDYEAALSALFAALARSQRLRRDAVLFNDCVATQDELVRIIGVLHYFIHEVVGDIEGGTDGGFRLCMWLQAYAPFEHTRQAADINRLAELIQDYARALVHHDE